jgi:hypothetical protein
MYAKELCMKKIVGLLVMACVLSAAIFAQEEGEYKYKPFDMLIGINLGVSSALHARDLANEKRRFSFLFSADIGLTYDFYIFDWLSVNTGLLFHP